MPKKDPPVTKSENVKSSSTEASETSASKAGASNAQKAGNKPSLDGIEDRWAKVWETEGTYRFHGDRPREEVFSIDTPPPTVSGSLHVGHVFSYTHTDTLARYKRMRGFDVFYPMGWDDNGLPTERRVQNYFGVSCDPSLPYNPDFKLDLPSPTPSEKKTPKDKSPKSDGKNKAKNSAPISISRLNFVELCEKLTVEDEQVFEELWRLLGLSVDWSHTYTTINEHSRRISQLAFLKNLERNEAYQSEAPCLWDTKFQTAVAQAELEDRELKGAYYSLAFKSLAQEGKLLEIQTTRPELLPATVAVVAHPEDERYKDLFGGIAKTPLFGVAVPICAHPNVDPEKGSGIAMVCTFGDMADVTWWRELNLSVRAIMGKNGRFIESPPEGIDPKIYSELSGLTSKQARTRIAELLNESGELLGEPRPITHPVKFFEKGDTPLEIITTRQWYLKNGGRDEVLKQELLKRGEELNWIPEYMLVRYQNWVEGLNGDWLISRQRFFGVPIPLWYPLDRSGTPMYDSPIVPEFDTLPIDPSSAPPPGYEESQRGQPGGFAGDPDVMDTWATSSLTPFIACGWERNSELFSRTYPMDVRPQAHEIIRTWLFSTLVRSHLEEGVLPWKNASISGWVLDPDRKKMSKSVGNVVTPVGLVEKFGADAMRYWACSGRPGTDTAFEEMQIKNGRRLAVKLLNAGRFAVSIFGAEMDDADEASDETSITLENLDVGSLESLEPLDAGILSELATLIEACTRAFEAYDYARSLELTESFFWNFTDNYIELVKARGYGNTPMKTGNESANGAVSAHEAKSELAHKMGTISARITLFVCLKNLLKLFAPFMPFVAEEVWSSFQTGSIHTSNWPDSKSEDFIALPDLTALPATPPTISEASPTELNPSAVYETASNIISQIRKYKSTEKVSLNHPLEKVEITADPQTCQLAELARTDIVSAGRIQILTLIPDPDHPPNQISLSTQI